MLIPVAVVNEGFGTLSPGPPPVSGYVGWYDASDLSTVPVTAGTNLLTAWNDKSANGFNLAVTSGRPSRIRNTNGAPVVLFDGLIGAASLSQLNTLSISMADRTFSAFVVAMVTGLERGQALLGPNSDGGNGFVVAVTTGALTTISVDVATIGSQSNASVTAGVPFVAGQVLTATDVTQYLNLASETDVDATVFSSPRTLRVGATPSASSPFNSLVGWIGEIVVYDTSLSAGDATSVITYLMNRWSIT